ncbi:MAG TPA: hypothetical protein DCX60_01395 [Phycisphaerales bacterium]|nr:hypothetical protein [Phycisphaerales bacterium]
MHTPRSGWARMHPSMMTGSFRIGALIASTCLIASCTTPLPRLEPYSASHSMESEQTVSRDELVSTGNLEETIESLLKNPDPDVRRHAVHVVRMLDDLEDERRSAILEIMRNESDDLEIASRWASEGDEEDRIQGVPNPVEMRDRFISEAIEAERSGEFAKANRLASVAMSMELIVEDDAIMDRVMERPLRISARNTDRMKNIRMVDPRIAMTMSDSEFFDDFEPGNESPSEHRWRTEEESRHRVMNTRRVIEYLDDLHVDEIDRSIVHESGLDEIVLVTRKLIDEGHPIPGKYLEAIESERSRCGERRTLDLLLDLEMAQTELAEGTLPPSFSMRVFGDGAASALDGQTSVIWPGEFEQYTKAVGRGYRGIGVRIEEEIDGTVVLRPTNGGPARQSGIRNGDILLEVDGRDIEEIGARGLSEVIDNEGREWIELLVEHDDGVRETVRIRIGPVVNVNITGWRQTGLLQDGRPTWWWLADDRRRIGYLRLERFFSGGAHAVRTALQEAQKQALSCGGRLEGLVLDLRSNPGGQVFVAEEIINLFMGDGPVFRSIGRGGVMETEYADENHSELEGIPLVILVDELSASASEVVAGQLKMNGKAIVLGERTFGKGSIQGLIPASSPDCLVRVTIGWYQLPVGGESRGEWRFVDRDISPGDWGVQPDIRIAASAEQTRRMIEARSMWHSGVGLDVRIEDHTEVEDPSVELALGLLIAWINRIDH